MEKIQRYSIRMSSSGIAGTPFLQFYFISACTIFFWKTSLSISFYIIFFSIEEMGCGVAMTVIQTKELINIENFNKLPKPVLRTNNNILKANQSQPSIFMIKNSPTQTKTSTEPINQNQITVPINEKSIVKQEQKGKLQQKQIQKKEPPHQKALNDQKIAFAKVPTVQKASVKIEKASVKIEKPKQSSVAQKTDIIKSPRLQKNNYQHKAVMIKQGVKAQKSMKGHSTPSQQKNKADLSKPICQNTQPLVAIKQDQSLSKEKVSHDKKMQQKQINIKQGKAKTNQLPNMTKKEQKDQNRNIQILAEKDKQLTKRGKYNDYIIKKEVKPIEKSSNKQLVQIKPFNSPRNIGSKTNLDKKMNEKILREDPSRKSLKVKKQMVHLDSLYLQSNIIKPEQPDLEKQNTIDPKPPTPKKEEVSIRIPQDRKSKNAPIQIVDNLVQIEKNLEKPKIVTTTAIKVEANSKPINPKVTKQQSIRRITEQKKKGDQEKKTLQSSQKLEDQKRKAEQLRRIQQGKKKILQQQKKSLEIETNKLKKVYHV